MDVLQQYIFPVICVCLLCCILQLIFTGNNHMMPLIKMCTGLVLSLTVFMPLIQNKSFKLEFQMDELVAEKVDAVEEGEKRALETLSTIIKENTEAYILEKANGLGMDIHPEITLSNDNPPVPYAVTIEGMCTPFARKQLSVYLHQNLGLSEEYQTWIS